MSTPIQRPLGSAPAEPRRLVRGRHRASRVEPTFFQRFECKYLVSPLVVPEIRDFIRPFMRPDSFAARRADGRYVVSSLYLDTADLRLYRQTDAGEKDRFKLRIRTYSDEPETPAFLEVKRRVNAVVHKRRVGLTRDEARSMVTGKHAAVLSKLGGRRQADAEYFDHHRERTNARPVVRVQYMREAYEATGNEPVRVTLDSGLRHAVTFAPEFGLRTGSWIDEPLDRIIVEIKFTERFPWWLGEFARRFELRQRSVPKYGLSIDHMLENGHASSLSIAGFTLPPKGS